MSMGVLHQRFCSPEQHFIGLRVLTVWFRIARGTHQTKTSLESLSAVRRERIYFSEYP